MSNPLQNLLGGTAVQNTPRNDFSAMLSELQSFRAAFRGDPSAEVRRLVESGRMTQAQFNELGQMANQLLSLMK